MRKALKERGLLEDFLKSHPYAKSRNFSNFGEVAREPLFNYLDVSGSVSLPVMTLTQGVMDATLPAQAANSFPSFRNHTALWGVEASSLPLSQPHSTCVPAFTALNVTTGRV